MGNKKVLITGGFGALGYNLTKYLSAAGGYDIYILDNLTSGVANFTTDYPYSILDISNREKVDHFFAGYKPNIIFHLAAHFANQNSVDHPVSDASTNILGMINLFEAQRSNKELEKVVYASSSCVYGGNPVMKEDENISPYDTPYAINKYAGELYCKYYAKIIGLPVVCARIFNSFGPGEMPGQYRNVIPNFILKALKNEDIVITGTGNETRDFTFVSDTIDLLVKLAFSEFAKGEVFNAGTGRKTTIRDLTESIIAATNSGSKIIYKERRNWDLVQDRCSDISKSRSLLGYNPQTDLQKGLQETVQWIRSRLQREHEN